MKLKDIAVISGRPGLYRVIKPGRSGVLVEPIGAKKKTKMMMNANYRVSILKEIAIYTTTAEESVPLKDVLYTIHEKYGDKVEVKKDDESLREFMESVLPEYDLERVYPSDIKKVTNWYNLLVAHYPELLVPSEEEDEDEAQEESEKKEEASK